MTIRPARVSDLAAINGIYNHYVLNSTATYQTEPSTPVQRREWFDAHGDRHPVLVAEEDATVIGWASLSPFHSRAAFALTVEDSIYIHPGHLRRGLGRAMLGELIIRGRELGHRTIIAVISADQEPSVKLHTSMGFEPAGLLRDVGRKFDRWLDVTYLQLML